MFPCDTRLEAFPPYLSRVSSLTRLFFVIGKKYGKSGGYRHRLVSYCRMNVRRTRRRIDLLEFANKFLGFHGEIFD